MTIRIGEGRTKDGKIIDRDTKWFNYSEKESAIECAIETGKKIYINDKRSAYKEITLDELKNL